MFVKWSCGCVGLSLPVGNWVIEECDRDWTSAKYGLSPRNMEDKSKTELSEPDTVLLLEELSKQLHAGHLFRELKSILRN